MRRWFLVVTMMDDYRPPLRTVFCKVVHDGGSHYLFINGLLPLFELYDDVLTLHRHSVSSSVRLYGGFD